MKYPSTRLDLCFLPEDLIYGRFDKNGEENKKLMNFSSSRAN